LAEFGEIRITRVEPETTVAWEGDRASGTVELSPTGWGTKVVLTAVPAAPSPGRPRAAPDEPDCGRKPEARAKPPAPASSAEPPRVEAPSAPPPAEVFSGPRVEAPPPEAKRGFFARLFGKR